MCSSDPRTTDDVYGEIRNVFTEAEWHEDARIIRLFRDKTELGTGEIAVVTAGTSDIPVAEEARSAGNKMVWELVEQWLKAQGGKNKPRQLNAPKVTGVLPNPGYAA